MAMPSWTHLGIGLGLTALFITLAARASGSSSTRYINVEGTTMRMKKLEGGRFEVAIWGVGLLFSEEPSGTPAGTYMFGQDGPISASGNPGAINFIEASMNKVPEGLFTEEFKRCERPGCFVKPPESVPEE